ncbi:MAG: AI-2E family transporter [Bryobacterales bacterium]|nr:AI-2E family transporter [Bryobacterales bacterium]
MLGIQAHAARVAWTIFLVALAIATAYLIRRTVLIFILALFFAYMLTPLVDLVYRFVPPRFSRTLALAIVYIVLIGALSAAGFALGSRIADETSALAKKLPQTVDNIRVEDMRLPRWLEPARVKIVDGISSLQTGGEHILPVLRSIGQKLLSFAGNLGFAVLVPILAFFFLKDGTLIRDTLLNQLNEGPPRKLVEGILSDIHVLLGQYIRALVLLSLATLAVYSIFFSIAGVPYSVLMGSLCAMLEFIPVLGPLLGVIVVLVVSLAAGYNSVLMLLIFFGVYRLFQDYVLQPYLMSSGVEMHPLIVLFGALAGEQIGGVAGLFLSVPVLATLRVIYVRALRSRQISGEAVQPLA